MNSIATNLHGLPRRLVQGGKIPEPEMIEAIEQSRKAHTPLVHFLVDKDFIKPSAIALEASLEFGMPLYDISGHQKEAFPVHLVDKKLLTKHKVVPIGKRSNRLYLGISDPTNHQATTEIQFQSGMIIEPILVPLDILESTLDKILHEQDSTSLDDALGEMDDVNLDSLDIESVGEDDEQDISNQQTGDDAPIVKFVNKMLLDAIKMGASDLHFEPYERSYRVRFRVDGILREMTRPPVALAPRLAARLKVMAQLDISERRVPQDGRVKLRLSKNKAIDFRVNTLPLQYGEKIVMRILDPTSAQMGIESLGYEDDQKQMYMEALARPQGMILVTGPTGSGKTVSLYTGLNILNTPECNISTAEDPIEINLEGINQTQVNARVGLTFSEALRAFLRQDPDVVMVGEIRDLETAEIAIKAAQTGHLVLSTLHTNSAPETLTRLMNMGVPTFNVATSVNLIIAQRLARRLCSHCKQPAEIPERVLEEEGFMNIGLDPATFKLHKAVGCSKCTNGYKGRVGVYEVLKITPAISRIIMDGGSSLDILQKAKEEGFRTLRQSALRKAAEGLMGLEEANRVTKD